MIIAGLLFASLAPAAADAAGCPVAQEKLTQTLRSSVKPTGGPSNAGFDNNEWAAVVARDGTVCAVTMSGNAPDDQWLASRAIAAEKANTANALSLKSFSLSTANLYAASAPAGSLFGMNGSNPVATDVLYAGDRTKYGSSADPMIGKQIGGVIVFGGGLALYNETGIIGALGVSGDSSCADHNVAWRVRQALGLDRVPAGVGPDHNDEIIYDMLPDKTSASGYGHPKCGGKEPEVALQIHAGYAPSWATALKE